ncbi:MAG: DUF177 domain-containing protein [Burkholderiaceae bacterium]|nr:DUF177 domain-containing protein [Burkholderiaceae bacterium]
MNEASRKLDVARLAQTGQLLAGARLLSDWKRLAKACQGIQADLMLNWRATGEHRALAGGGRHPALHLRADALLPLVCRRCLGEVRVPVSVDRHFVFLPDETAAAALDEQEEDDLLALVREFDLQALIEDEMLLALPLAPAHASCPQPLKTSVQDAGFDAASGERAHPFAALGELKRR